MAKGPKEPVGGVFLKVTGITIPGEKSKNQTRYKSGAKKPEGLDDKRILLMHLGQATTSWSLVEQALCELFVSVLGEDKRMVARAIYWSIIGIETRVDMVGAAIHASPKLASAIDEWKVIYTQVSKKRKIRNKLAHFKIVFDATDLRNQQFRLVPMVFRTDKPGYNWVQLMEFQQKFMRLMLKIEALTSTLRAL